MTERQLQEAVLKLARLCGWRCYHTFDSRRSQAGFPDLVLVRPPRLLFVELKSARGRTTPDQQAWLEALGMVRAPDAEAPEVYLWRPSRWTDGTVEALLRPARGAR